MLNPESTDTYDRLRQSIRRFAMERGICQNEAICNALEIGLKALENGRNTPSQRELKGLSARQRAVLKALRKGFSVKEVAEQLDISEVTVRTHIHRIRMRLDCPDILKLRMM